MLCQFGVMRDDQQRGTGFGAAREEQFDDFVPGRSIEIAGGFVGENQVGAGGDGTRMPRRNGPTGPTSTKVPNWYERAFSYW